MPWQNELQIAGRLSLVRENFDACVDRVEIFDGYALRVDAAGDLNRDVVRGEVGLATVGYSRGYAR